jgi:predicted Zn-dependent peptidase
MIEEVRSTRLPNGLTVLTEHMPGLRSVTAGIWVRRGSRHEAPELNGICHFIEHAVFKGPSVARLAILLLNQIGWGVISTPLRLMR